MFFYHSNIKVTNTLFLYHFQNRKIEIIFSILSIHLGLKMDINNKRKEKTRKFMEAKEHTIEPTLGKEDVRKEKTKTPRIIFGSIHLPAHLIVSLS